MTLRDDNWLGLHKADARRLADIVPAQSVDLILTSPPYAALKDYGCEEQIGFGQTFEEYLQDMQGVLAACYNVAKPTATMWLIADTFKKDGEMVNLPAKLSDCATSVKWKLQDIVIWHKTKTLPWSHHGKLRKVFEQVMVFAKSNSHKYYPERVSETVGLQQWWVKYPERYNPCGKSPHDIWYFPIPTQGSWSNTMLRHFNPFPPSLVERVVELTTDLADVVLDPFAGSGTVLAQAECMGRRAVGCELNGKFVHELFPRVREQVHRGWDRGHDQRVARRRRTQEFQSLILRMRKVKFAKQLIRTLDGLGKNSSPTRQPRVAAGLLLNQPTITESLLPKFKLDTAYVVLVLTEDLDSVSTWHRAHQLCTHPPLSKYGIAPSVECVPRDLFPSYAQHLLAGFDTLEWHVYPAGTNHYCVESVSTEDVLRFCLNGGRTDWMKNGLAPLFSPIRVHFAEIRNFLP